MAPAETILDYAAALGVTLWADQIDGEELIRYSGATEAVDLLAPAILLFHADLWALLCDRLPGEPERTAAAPWACPCCARFFSEDQLSLGGWCVFCLSTVLDECIKLDQRSDEPEEVTAG